VGWTGNGIETGVRVALMGGFALTWDGRRLTLSRCTQRLVAYLALRSGWVRRAAAAADIWPDAEPDQARAALRSALARLGGLDRARLLEKAGDLIRLHPQVAVDAREHYRGARQVIDQARLSDHGALEALCERGELLPDWAEEWVVLDREQLHELRLHALETAATLLTEQGRMAEAAQAALAAVQAEPLRESAARALVRVHLAEGNWGLAITHYRAYCRVLRRELGLEPSPQMRALFDGIWPPAARVAALAGASAG
jgi:DNA-binding SARP family transcriptional activator